MTATWLPWAKKADLSARMGNGPFRKGAFRGVVLHVNVGDTPDQFFIGGGGPSSVCPNVQIHGDGATTQFLPLEHSPWCQSDGNANYGAIEVAGDVGYPMNPAQVASVAKVVRAYHDAMGMPLQLADAPGQVGFGFHAMGGRAWGGHPCPGPIRIAQRKDVLAVAAGGAIPQGGIATPIADTAEQDWFDMVSKQEFLDTLRSEGISGAADSSIYGPKVLALVVQGVTETLRSEGVSGAGDVARLASAVAATVHDGDASVDDLADKLAAELGPDLGKQVVAALGAKLSA